MARVDTFWNPPRATDEQLEAALGDNAGFALLDRTRMSRLLCEQLAFGISTRTLNSFAVTDVLEALEGHGPRAGQVLQRPFRRPPLRGLLHAHFVQASFIAHNLANEIQRRGAWSVHKHLNSAPSEALEGDVVKHVAHEATIGLYAQRSSRDALTGEWIIYAEHQGQRLYFGLAEHATDDEAIHSQLVERCEERFRDAIRALTSPT